MNKIWTKYELTSILDSAKDSRWSSCSFWATSLCLWLYHETKFGLLKNRRYKPSQSPLILEVSWGPQLSNDERNSSWLKGFTLGAARYGEMFLASGIRLAKYLSNGIMKVCVSSRKCRRISADWTALGLLSWTPFWTRLTIALSLSRNALVDE